MAVIAQASRLERARVAVRGRVGAAHLVLGGIVAASIAVRVAVAWARAMPMMFPDEYIYSAMARSLAAGDAPFVRGRNPHFPALLEPLLTAPAWAVRDVATAFHLAQTINVVAFSLAAVPAFLLARRLGSSERLALGVAALAVAVPDLLYAGFILAEPVAYPLVLWSVLAGVAALERPTRRRQAAFVALAALTAFARLQFVVLPAAYVLAMAIVALREGRLRATLRQQRAALAVSLAAALGLVALGYGFYKTMLHHQAGLGTYVHGIGVDGYLLLFACGLVVVPGALLGFWLALSAPRSRAELAFAALSLPLVALLLVESGFYGAEPHERYVFYGAPLLAVAFALYATRGWPRRTAHALLAAGVVTLATTVPLTVLGEGHQLAHSPVLLALQELEARLGTPGAASMLPLAVAGVGCLLAAGLSFRPQLASFAAVGASLVLAGGFYAAAVRFDQGNTDSARAGVLPRERSWVDAAGVSSAPLVAAAGVQRMYALEQLFWNRAIDRVYVLPHSHPIDAFAYTPLGIRPDGTLLAGGEPVRGPLVLDEESSFVRLRDSRVLARGTHFDLVRPGGVARLDQYFVGRYRDGYVAPEARIFLWPSTAAGLRGSVRLRLRLPDDVTITSSLVIRVTGHAPLRYTLRPHVPLTVSIPACTRGMLDARLAFGLHGNIGNRPASALTTVPRYVPDAAACAGGPLF